MNIKERRFQGDLPGDIDSHILLGGAGQHPEQLIQGGWQELDHHMALHSVETLRVQRDKDMFSNIQQFLMYREEELLGNGGVVHS